MNKYIFKLPENRVRRNYTGGAALDMFKRKVVCEDCQRPEEWILSTVEAKNPGMPPIKNEGLSFLFDDAGQKLPITELLKKAPEFYLGKSHYEKYGLNIGFLSKLLDSSIRLHVQAHPTKEFAARYLNSRWGKLECYYILGVRPGYKPYIRSGFQHAPSRKEWKNIIESQDIERMDACFEKIPVSPGQVWFIPGGLPHAIGEGLLMVEVMEPTDLVIRCEFEREGIVVPPSARFMGRDIDFALDIFNYTGYTPEEIERRNLVPPSIMEEKQGYKIEKLIDHKITDCFEIEKLTASEDTILKQDGRFHTGIVCRGEAEISCNGEVLELKTGDCYFAGAAAETICFAPLKKSELEICIIKPGW